MEYRLDYTSKEFILPDIESTFRVYAAHWRRVGQGWSYPQHHHSLFEVNLVLMGEQEIAVNQRRYVQRSGDIVILKPGDQHESHALGEVGMEYYCLHFDVDERSLRELLYRNPSCFYEASSILTCSIRPAMDKLLALTCSEADCSVVSRMSILSALFELFAGLSSFLSEQSSSVAHTRDSQTASRVAQLLEQAVEEISYESDAESADTIARIASKVGYSPSSINRMFSRVYGESPRQYMSGLILKRAKLLLMNPKMTIEMISYRLGYAHLSHFSRQFKRWTGESPSQFRDRYR